MTTPAMILTIKFSGGMGVSYQGSVDLSSLPGALSKAVRTELSVKAISGTRGGGGQYTIDSTTYSFQYENSGEKFTVDESEASDELLELIDSLRPFLTLEPK